MTAKKRKLISFKNVFFSQGLVYFTALIFSKMFVALETDGFSRPFLEHLFVANNQICGDCVVNGDGSEEDSPRLMVN